MDASAGPSPLGDYVVSVGDARTRALPATVARLGRDDALVLLYVLDGGPGAASLLCDAPDIVASLDAHCGVQRH